MWIRLLMDSCSLTKEDQQGCGVGFLSSAAHSHSSGEADHQITLPAGYMGSGLIGAALISCVCLFPLSILTPNHPFPVPGSSLSET
jgi:hypothetical protein